MTRQLLLDGLDYLRDQMDEMAERCTGWQFMAMDAGEPHPIGTVQIAAYNKDTKRSAGIVIPEESIEDRSVLGAHLRALEAALHNDG